MHMPKAKVGWKSLLKDEILILNDMKQGCMLAPPCSSYSLFKLFGTAIQ